MFGGMSPPMITNSMNSGAIIVRHREYIGDIISTTAFTNRNFPINPGMVGTFPWLAQIANAFEQYRFRGLIFEFKSLSADALISASTNIGQGTVIMATQYNALSPGFSTKIEMENYEFANSCKPSCSFMHPVECATYQTPNTPLYVRSGAIPTGSDERLYDLGNFNLATQGLPSDTGSVGELWATFEIELFKPKYNPNTAEGLGVDNFSTAGNINITANTPFGNPLAAFYKGTIGCAVQHIAVDAETRIRITWPGTSTEVGEVFEVSYYLITDTAITASNQPLTIGSGTNASQGLILLGSYLPNTATASSGNVAYDNTTGAAGTSQVNRILFSAMVGVVSVGANPHIEIGGFDDKYGAQTLANARAQIMVKKIPTTPAWFGVPDGPQNITVLGTE